MINPTELLSLHWQNYFDIFIVAVVIYGLYIWLRGTRAFHILIGLCGLGMVYIVASWGGFFLTSWLLQYLLGVLLLLIIVIFQPEIRQLLEKVSPLAFLRQKSGSVPRAVLMEIAEACYHLGDQRIGALLVIPRTTSLMDIVREGVPIDSVVTRELLVSIFHPTSPLHDGAVMIENGRLVRAGSYLPLSSREGLPSKYGTRHRAAIGITEHSDAVCVVVSEERGVVSITEHGEIEPLTGEDSLRQRLEDSLLPASGQKTSLRAALIASIRARLNFQEIFQNNLGAKFLAFGLSCLLWFLLVGQQYSETFTTAKLEYQNIPADLHIIGAPTSEVTVRVRGPRGSIATLTPNQVRVMVNLANMTSGPQTLALTEDNLRLPLGLEASSIEPQTLTLHFDRIITRQFHVQENITGELPDSLSLASVDIIPNSIELRGPEMELDQIEQVTTIPIDLSGFTSSQMVRCRVKIIPAPSSTYRIFTPEVNVNISLSGVTSRKKVENRDIIQSVSGTRHSFSRLPNYSLNSLYDLINKSLTFKNP